MIGLGIGLLAGIGLFLVWWSCWPVEPRRQPSSVRSRWRDRWSDDLVLAGVPGLGPARLVGLSVGTAALVFLVVLGLTHVVAIAGCFSAMAGVTPPAFVRSAARRARSRLRDAWPDVVDNLASAVRAGLSLPEALGQLGQRGPERLRAPFAAFARDYRAGGRFSDALDALKDRLSDPVGDKVIESLRVARDVGGSDLGQLLRTLSAFLRQENRTRAELESRQSWTVNGARVAVAAPWIVLAMLSTRPESIAAYGQPTGAVVLVVGAVVSGVAYRAMLRIARLPEDERVLR